jgi:hypothetical protein
MSVATNTSVVPVFAPKTRFSLSVCMAALPASTDKKPAVGVESDDLTTLPLNQRA